jgi:hypothetical protein
MKPRFIAALTALAVGALIAPAAPAVAAPAAAQVAIVAPAAVKATGKVTVKKIATKTVKRGKKTTVKASYKVSGKVKIVSARVTVTKGKKSYGKNKSSVSLAAGKYTVKQQVSYKLRSGKGWGKTRTAKLTQSLTIKTAAAKKVPRSQQNALGMAKQYLDYTAFSRESLIGQLEYEGFSYSDASWAADKVGANWNKQAARMAQQYLDYTYFSRDGLIGQLEYEGFTASQARYGVNAVGL